MGYTRKGGTMGYTRKGDTMGYTRKGDTMGYTHKGDTRRAIRAMAISGLSCVDALKIVIGTPKRSYETIQRFVRTETYSAERYTAACLSRVGGGLSKGSMCVVLAIARRA